MLRLAETGQMRVDRSDDRAGVAEVDLNLAQVLTLFEQMRGVGMSERVNVRVLFDAAGLERQTESALQRGALNRFSGRGRAASGMALAREQERGMPMSFPLFAQEQQRALRQRDVAVAISFARADVQEHALGIHVADLEVQAFAQTQAAGIDGGQADAMIQSGHAGQDAAHFSRRKHDREFELVIGADEPDFGGPRAAEGLFPEEFDGAEGLGGSLAGDFLLALEVNEVLAEFFGRDEAGRFGIELTELAEAGEVGLLGAGLDADQLEVIGKRIKDGVRGTFFICMGALMNVEG